MRRWRCRPSLGVGVLTDGLVQQLIEPRLNLSRRPLVADMPSLAVPAFVKPHLSVSQALEVSDGSEARLVPDFPGTGFSTIHSLAGLAFGARFPLGAADLLFRQFAWKSHGVYKHHIKGHAPNEPSRIHNLTPNNNGV